MALLVSYMFSTVAFATEGEQPSDQPVPEEMPSQEPENDAYMVSLDPQTISDYLEYRQSNVVKEQGDRDNEQSQRYYGQRNDTVSYAGRRS